MSEVGGILRQALRGGSVVTDMAVQTIRIAVTGCETVEDVHKALDNGLYFIAGDLEHERTTPMTKPTAEDERAAVVAWLREQSRRSWFLTDSFPWWRLRLRFANKVAATTFRIMANRIERGDHHKGKD